MSARSSSAAPRCSPSCRTVTHPGRAVPARTDEKVRHTGRRGLRAAVVRQADQAGRHRAGRGVDRAARGVRLRGRPRARGGRHPVDLRRHAARAQEQAACAVDVQECRTVRGGDRSLRRQGDPVRLSLVVLARPQPQDQFRNAGHRRHRGARPADPRARGAAGAGASAGDAVQRWFARARRRTGSHDLLEASPAPARSASAATARRPCCSTRPPSAARRASP